MKAKPLFGLGCSIITLTAAGQPASYVASTSLSDQAAKISRQNVPTSKAVPVLLHWDRALDEKIGPVDKRAYKEMVKQSQFFASYLQDSCSLPDGAGPAWHGEFVAEGKGSGQELSSTVVGEFASAELRLSINDPHELYHDTLYVNNKMYTMLVGTPVPRDGALFFEASGAAGGGADNTDARKQAIWLILGDNMPSPYLPVTRKEYLTEATQELLAEKAAAAERAKQQNPVRSENVQKADKAAAVSLIEQTCSGVQLQVRMRSFLAKYKTDEELQQEAVSAVTAELDSTLHLMAQLLDRLPVEELERPAFVSVRAHSFEGFEDLITHKAMLVKANPVFHNPGSGSIVPNVLVASLSWINADASNAAAVAGSSPFPQFNPGKLKALLK